MTKEIKVATKSSTIEKIINDNLLAMAEGDPTKETEPTANLSKIIMNEVKLNIRSLLLMINNQEIVIDTDSIVSKQFIEDILYFSEYGHVSISKITIDTSVSFVEQNKDTIEHLSDFYTVIYPQ